MRAVDWSKEASTDFLQMLAYLADHDSDIAYTVTQCIETAISSLSQYPTGRPGRVDGTYEKSVDKTSYIIVYGLGSVRLEVIRIIHTSRNWPPGNWPEE